MADASEGMNDESLKRLGGGRWQTRDERFTIEPQSGTWAVVDAEETDDLGLPLVRGPFRSLTDAKAAIAAARTTEAPASPLAERLERSRTAPKGANANTGCARVKARDLIATVESKAARFTRPRTSPIRKPWSHSPKPATPPPRIS